MAKASTVMLTNPIHPEGAEILSEVAEIVVAADTDAATLRWAAAHADGIIVRAKLPGDIFDHAPRVRGVVRHGVGLDFIPIEEATSRHIPVANLPGSNTQAVAEYVFSALFHVRRPVGTMDATLRTAGWGPARLHSEGHSEIGATVLGVIGAGAIGARVAAMASQGFGMRVLCNSRSGSTLEGLVEAVDLPTLFQESDAVVVACPLTPQTLGLVDAQLIRRMRPSAILINVARGPIVDTEALLRALDAQRIRGAALDVFDVQPLRRDDAIFAHPNLLLTPHAAGLTETSSRAMGVRAAEEMVRILTGRDPLNLVNPGYRAP